MLIVHCAYIYSVDLVTRSSLWMAQILRTSHTLKLYRHSSTLEKMWSWWVTTVQFHATLWTHCTCTCVYIILLHCRWYAVAEKLAVKVNMLVYVHLHCTCVFPWVSFYVSWSGRLAYPSNKLELHVVTPLRLADFYTSLYVFTEHRRVLEVVLEKNDRG